MNDGLVNDRTVKESQRRLGASAIRFWRWLAGVAFVVVFTATHWPRLMLSAEGPSDKLIHGISFGLLTFLLWRTRMFSNAWIACVVMSAFAAIDESTQMLPCIERQTSLDDWVADLVGIVCATLFLAPVSKPRSAVAQLRARLDDAADREMFDRPLTCATLAASAALGVLVGVPLTVAISTTFLFDQRPWQTAFLGGVVFCAAAIVWTWHYAMRSAIRRVASARACFECGTSIVEGSAHSRSWGSCEFCAHAWRSAQWVIPSVVHECAIGAHRRATNVGIVRGGILSILILGSIAVFGFLFARHVDAGGWTFGLVPSMRDLFSYAFAVTAIAIVMRCVKSAQARVREQEGVRCVACDHDVHLVSVALEQGTCPECGRAFIRLDSTA